MPAVLEQAAEILGLPIEELERQSLRAFFEKELRAMCLESLAICQKYGVHSWKGMDELIVEDKVEEGGILDDFQRVDYLTARVKQVQALLEQM